MIQNNEFVSLQALRKGDPPPDRSIDRFPIYARLEVPELWCYDEGELKIYQLQNGEYLLSETSLALPMLPIQELPQLIETYRSAGRS